MTPNRAATNRATSSRLLLGVALMLVAFNLRPALSTVGPLLATII